MNCPHCTNSVPSDASFCPKCGREVTAKAASESPPSAAAQFRQRTAATDTTNSSDAEQDMWRGGFSPKAMLGYWLLAGIVTVAAFVASVVVPLPEVWLGSGILAAALWLAFAGYFVYERLSVEYALTSQRFVHKTGILRRTTNRIEVIDIDDVTFEQGLIERMVGVGTIQILSSDMSHPKLVLRGIDDVQRVADLVDRTRREERRKRGLHIETV